MKYFSIKYVCGTNGKVHAVVRLLGVKLKFNATVLFPFSKIKYRLFKKKKPVGVVYTCITGGYDPVPKAAFVDPKWEYILFTDNEELIKKGKSGVWKIRPLQFSKLDDTKNSRWHKTHPHVLFPEHDKSLWVDSNIVVLTDKLFRQIKTEGKILVPIHYERDCVYDECDECERTGKDSPENINQNRELLIGGGMPKHWGLSETNIMFRHHKDPSVIKIMEEWWEIIRKFSKRDQLSWSYVLWKNGIRPEDIKIDNARDDKENYIVNLHFISPPPPIENENFLKTGSDLLFYTYANSKYYPFAILYPLFALNFNKDAVVEIALENEGAFRAQYGHLIDFYKANYPGRVYYHQIDFKMKDKVQPGALRFLTEPKGRAKYVYIGDVDILILEEVLEKHLNNIKENDLDYSNILRIGEKKLSGLHFIEYDKMYPVLFPENLSINDEELLYVMMKQKGYKIPKEGGFRPLHGLHISFYSRMPFETLTTNDRRANYPTWFSEVTDSFEYTKIYLDARYKKPFVDFTSAIKDADVELRRLIQIIDISVLYYHDKTMRGV